MSQKIALVTTWASDNYGAVLQSFALQATCEKLGLKSEFLNYKCPALIELDRPRFWNRNPRTLVLNCLRHLAYPRYYQLLKKRKQLFETFRIQHFKQSPSYSRQTLASANESYQYFVSGSDQVFNLEITKGDPSFLLDFVTPNGKKKTYGASFGYRVIPKLYQSVSVQYISQFSSLLMREDQAVTLVKEMANNRSKVAQVLDPVFLSTPEEWKNVFSISSKKFEDPYLLLYCIGPESSLVAAAKAYAKERHLKIIQVLSGRDLKVWKQRDWEALAPDPEGFLTLIANASCVFAHSFHGVALSILFNIPFFFPMPSNGPESDPRTSSLFHVFDLPPRYIHQDGTIDENPLDWAKINKIIAEQRAVSLTLFSESLGIN